MDILVSPCKKYDCRGDRKICSRRCKKLAEYRRKLGNPLENCCRGIFHPLELAKTGCFWTLPVPRWVIEQERYNEYDEN